MVISPAIADRASSETVVKAFVRYMREDHWICNNLFFALLHIGLCQASATYMMAKSNGACILSPGWRVIQRLLFGTSGEVVRELQ
jgi:hypothetical protein